ncbi:MAG: TorD/DmsD family molecular chaperone [Saccharofermentanales bacterium]|jgi:anaerobic sulfite reductase subunit A
MNMQDPQQIWLRSRQIMYRLMSRLYWREVDETLLAGLKKMPIPADCADHDLQVGWNLFGEAVAGLGDECLEELAVDFAVTFLGAGTAKPTLMALPFASVYTSIKRMLMQDARDRAVAAYRSKGLQVGSHLAGLPEDHLAVLLDFMAFLCGTNETTAPEDVRLQSALQEQQTFLEQHLLNWIGLFCEDVAKLGKTPFYRAVAGLTEAYLQFDARQIQELRQPEAICAVSTAR